MYQAFYKEFYESCKEILERPSELSLNIPISMNKETEVQQIK